MTMQFAWLCFFFLLVAPAVALAPVHPDASLQHWAKVREQQANATHNFQPRFIPPEHCHHLSEDDCKKVDLKRGLQDTEARGNPSIGAFQVLVLLINFPENDASMLPNKDYFDTLFNGDGVSDVNPVGSIKEFLLYNSLGQYQVTFDIQDWAQTDKAAASFATGTDPNTGAPVFSARWSTNLPLQGIFAPILKSMEDSGFDFSPYDSDGDGKFDHLHIIHSGYPAELGAYECTPPAENMIWAQGSPSSPPETYVTGSGISVGGYTISSAWTMDVCSNTPTTMAVATHEFIHGFNVKDVYDTDYTESVLDTGGLGAFDTMAFVYGWTTDGTRPTMLSPYTKMECNWLTPLVINEDGLYAIQPAELSGQIYVITDPFPEGEYLIIEMRYGLKWDNDMTGRGLVIYHVDNMAGDDNLIQNTRGYPGHPNWPAEHYRVSVLQADGRYDIEQMINRGDETDFWTFEMALGPGPDFPNTDSIQGGIQTPTGVTITVTSMTSYIMQFQVSGMGSSRRLSDESSSSPDALDPELLALQGYVPYGNATLATEEQMKEFRGPRPTKAELYRMYQNEVPADPFDYRNDITNNVRGSANVEGNSDGGSQGQASESGAISQLTGLVATALAFYSLACICL